MDRMQGTRKRDMALFVAELRAAWVADLDSEPEPVMPEVEAALARVRAGGVA